jgi:hypothetical protein
VGGGVAQDVLSASFQPASSVGSLVVVGPFDKLQAHLPIKLSRELDQIQMLTRPSHAGDASAPRPAAERELGP